MNELIKVNFESERITMIKRLKTERLILILIIIISLFGHLVYGIEGAKQTQTYEYKIERQAAQLKDKDYQIEILEIILKNREQDASEPMATEPEYIGEFEITYYTAWDVLPPGTKVYIDGIGERIVEDTGGAIVDKCIDVYVEDLEVALQGGRHKADVWIVKEKKQ